MTAPQNIQLIVTDMDGTLLDEHHNIPQELWPLLEEMHRRNIVFAPASGRQLATLQKQFAPVEKDLSIIAENGTVVYHNGEIVSLTTVDPDTATEIINIVDAHPEIDWGLVLCRADGAYVTRSDNAFLDECDIYYTQLEVVSDLHPYVNDEVIKLAIYCFSDAEIDAVPMLHASSPTLPLTVSGKHWIDIMNPDINKGIALQELADALDIPIENTVAFGDFLNDYELVRDAGTSYAMANAHPRVKEVADHIAPANTEKGVIQVLQKLLG